METPSKAVVISSLREAITRADNVNPGFTGSHQIRDLQKAMEKVRELLTTVEGQEYIPERRFDGYFTNLYRVATMTTMLLKPYARVDSSQKESTKAEFWEKYGQRELQYLQMQFESLVPIFSAFPQVKIPNSQTGDTGVDILKSQNISKGHPKVAKAIGKVQVSDEINTAINDLLYHLLGRSMKLH